jgi:hypothetical protein
MNPRLDRYGDPLEDDDQGVVNQQVFTAPGGLHLVKRTSVRQHIAELRRILAESRARREAQH